MKGDHAFLKIVIMATTNPPIPEPINSKGLIWALLVWSHDQTAVSIRIASSTIVLSAVPCTVIAVARRSASASLERHRPERLDCSIARVILRLQEIHLRDRRTRESPPISDEDAVFPARHVLIVVRNVPCDNHLTELRPADDAAGPAPRGSGRLELDETIAH